MAVIIEMPKLSDTMEEGGVAEWLKKEGDSVGEGESFVSIETDKATMEYQSPEGGILFKILVPAGKTCALNEPIAIVSKKGEVVDVTKLLSDFAEKKGAKLLGHHGAGLSDKKSSVAVEPTVAVGKVDQIAEVPKQKNVITDSLRRIRVSPLAKKVALERGIDLSSVDGTGPNGRVVLRDLDTQAASGAAKSRRNINRADREVPASMMRKTIAKRLLAAKNEAPHFYLTISVNMSQVNHWRESLNRSVSKSDSKSPKISVTDLLIYVTSRALAMHPQVNASWEGDKIREFGAVHLAVAVALPQGLVTPVVRNADQLTVQEIARTTSKLFAKAKDGSLQNEDFSGGTFSISNLGMFGIEEFTAIINPPQAAILAVGATILTPIVNKSGAIVVEPMMKMTMSCDHRAVDGAVGAAFLQTLKSYLETPALMLDL